MKTGPVSNVATTSAESPPMFQVYPSVGNPPDSTFKACGPGVIVGGGGGDVLAAIKWAHDTIMDGRKGSGGDLVILTAASDNFRDADFAKVANFNSVRTIRIPPNATAKQREEAAAIIRNAHVVYMGGGDQSNYVTWKGTPVQAAIQEVYNKGGVTGGMSAGEAVLGGRVYDARLAEGHNVGSKELVANPYLESVSFTRDLFKLGPLKNYITDSHAAERDRFGRWAVFMGLQLDAGKTQ